MTIGTVEDCEVTEEGSAWGEVLRVFIELDLIKLLARGRIVNLKGNRLWVSITYEKLPRLRFNCGKLVRGDQGCDKEGSTG